MSASGMAANRSSVPDGKNLALMRFLLTALTLASSLISFVAYTLLLRSFGASSEVDRLFLASSVPVSLAGFVSGVMVYWLPPLLIRDSAENHSRYVSHLNRIVVVVVALSMLIPMMLLANSRQLATMQAAFIVISGLNVMGTVLVCTAQARSRYLKTGAYSTIVSLGLVAGVSAAVWLSNVWLVVIGQFCGSLLGWMWLASTLQVRVFTPGNERQPLVVSSAMVGNLLAIVLATMGFTLFPAIDALLSGQLAQGSLSIMSYAQKVIVALSTAVSLGAHVIGARRSHDVLREGGLPKLRAEARREVIQIVAFSMATLFAYELIGRNLLGVVLTSASMRAEDVNKLADCLRGMLIGLGPMAAMPYLFRVYYSVNIFRLPAVVGPSIAVGYALISAFLIPYFEIQALPIAYAVVWWMALALCVFCLSRRSLKTPCVV